MEETRYLRILVEDIHTTVVATVDSRGLPVTAAIDMMDWDEDGVYFLTARGKSFYDRLIQRRELALTGIKGEDTLHCAALSLRGRVRELGSGPLPRLFAKNPYMSQIYPSEESRRALTVFQIYQGNGEWFDLSQTPVERASFSFGGAEKAREGYCITAACTGCRSCEAACPQSCIDFSRPVAAIVQEHCLRCGNCMAACPFGAVERK